MKCLLAGCTTTATEQLRCDPPVATCSSMHLTHGGEAAVDRKRFSLERLYLRSKSLLHITDLQSS